MEFFADLHLNSRQGAQMPPTIHRGNLSRISPATMKQHHVPFLIMFLSLVCGLFLTSMALSAHPVHICPSYKSVSEKATLRGQILDRNSAEPIAFANVIVEDLHGVMVTGVVSDIDGKFSVEVDPGEYNIKVQFIAYNELTKNISVGSGEMLTLEFELSEAVMLLDEVEIAEEISLPDRANITSVTIQSVGGKGSRKRGKRSAEGLMAAPIAAPATISTGFYDAGAIHFSPDEHNTEEYDRIYENDFKEVIPNPVSTFSIDVDAASYANVRRFLDYGSAPPADAVRIEELVNYFSYDYPAPADQHPFAVYTEISDCPWNNETSLIHIGLQGEEISTEDLDPSNLVFLIDVSGSMSSANKLPLVKSSLFKLVDQLNPYDRVALVVYAGAAGEVLPSTPGTAKQDIKDAIGRLQSGGSTAGGAGIRLAYEIAKKNLIEEGNNRVILCTDGDFNVGMSSDGEMVRLIEEKRKEGVFLTVCGFGMGNYKDSKLEKLADKGNGNYFYIDREKEAHKVFVEQMRATLYTIAKDVKLQIEFNPAVVKNYRLIGYENRMLAREDFDDDSKDAGELGVGHTVTALYEVELVDRNKRSKGDQAGSGREFQELESEELRYQQHTVKADAYTSNEILTVKFRYKKPNENSSRLIVHPLANDRTPIGMSSDNFRWSAAVAAWGMILRDSEHKADADMKLVRQLAEGAQGADLAGYRADFLNMIRTSQKVLASQ